MKLIPPILLAVVSFAGILHATQDPAEAVRQFKESLKTVDRVVLMRTDFDLPKEKEKPKIVLEIKGSDVIKPLGETIEATELDGECDCSESPEMHFYRGESYMFMLTLHHSHRLRGRDAAWNGDLLLTDASAAKFRAWFSANGYDGFSQRHAELEKLVAEHELAGDRFLALFPEAVRDQLRSKDGWYDKSIRQKRREAFVTAYPDRISMIHACWRGFGLLSVFSDGGSLDFKWKMFLREILNSLDVGDLRAAFEHLPAGHDQLLLGAYRFYVGLDKYEGARKNQMVTEHTLARLVREIMPLAKDYEQGTLIRALAERPTKPTNGLLLEIAGSGPIALSEKYEDGSARVAPEPTLAFQALLALAKNKISECRPIIEGRLTDSPDPELRLAREVMLAELDGSSGIRMEHMLSRVGDVAWMAWELATKGSQQPLPVEALAALAEKSASYRLRSEAAEKLQYYGLRIMTDEEKASAILEDPRYRKAESKAEVDAALADYSRSFAGRKPTEAEQRVMALLNERKGRLLLEEGRFEQAIPLLASPYGSDDSAGELAFALQMEGRFEDARSCISGLVKMEQEENLAKRWARLGFLDFARGEFDSSATQLERADALDKIGPDEGPIKLMLYLSRLLAGKSVVAPSIRNSSLGSITTDGQPRTYYWPDTGSLFLQGQLTEHGVFAQIEKQKGRREIAFCEAHFFFSALCRAKGDATGELKHLESALATKAYTNQCFSLATVRFRELSAAKK